MSVPVVKWDVFCANGAPAFTTALRENAARARLAGWIVREVK